MLQAPVVLYRNFFHNVFGVLGLPQIVLFFIFLDLGFSSITNTCVCVRVIAMDHGIGFIPYLCYLIFEMS